MRVLRVIPSLASRTGGPAETVVQSSLAFRELGIETSIFATDVGAPASARERRRAGLEPEPGGLFPAGAETLDVRLFGVRRPYRFTFSPALYRALGERTASYDVVHIHGLYLFPHLAAYRQATRARRPYIVTVHGILDPYHRRHGRLRKGIADSLWQRRMLEGAAALHLETDDEARLVSDVAPAVPRVVTPTGIHWARFGELRGGGEFRRRFLGGHAGPVVMHIGRLSHKKAPDVLVRAFAVVARELPEALLVFVGPDDEDRRPKLETLATELGVSGKVVFTGMLPGEESRLGALAATDVWALPSNADNFGLAAAEALAAGLPVVISPHVNTAPEVGKARAALVREQDPEIFGAAILSLLRDPQARAELGARAREFARRYDWGTVAQPLAQMYFDVADGRIPA